MFLNNNDKTRVFGSEIYTKYMNISATLIEQEKWAPKDSTDILLAFARLRTVFNSKWRLSSGDSGQSLLRDAYY